MITISLDEQGHFEDIKGEADKYLLGLIRNYRSNKNRKK